MKNFSFSFSTGSGINHSWIKHCWKWSNLWIHTLFAKSLHFAKWVYHTKKLKKSWVLNLDRQLKQLISVFLRTNSFVAKKPPGRPEKLSEKEQRLIVRRVEKDPKTTLEQVRVLPNSFSTSKTVSKCTFRRILKKYGIVSRKPAKKFNLNKKQRLIRKRWCSRMLKKPLGFYPASIFHWKSEKVLEFFETKNIWVKSQSVEKTKTNFKKFIKSITFVEWTNSAFDGALNDTRREHLKSALNLRLKKRKV